MLGQPNFQIGDVVEKVAGYRWPGVVVSTFDTIDGKPRVVVECTAPEVSGALHIYAPAQLMMTGRQALAEEEGKR
jgi:hypothetical protein